VESLRAPTIRKSPPKNARKREQDDNDGERHMYGMAVASVMYAA